MQKNQYMKFAKSKGIKPEVLIVAAVFILACLYFLGLSVKNILFVISHNDSNDQSSITIKPTQTPLEPTVRPQTDRNGILTSELPENPVRTIRSIIGDSIQINDGDEWYQVGDVVEGLTRIVAIEPNRILIEYNGTQSYVPFDFSRITDNQQNSTSRIASSRPRTQITYVGTGQLSEYELEGAIEHMMDNWQQSLPPEQQARIKNRLRLNDLPREQQEAIEATMEELKQRVMNMSGTQQQRAMQSIAQHLLNWALSDSDVFPDFSLD